MPLTYRDIIKKGIFKKLTNMITDPTNARIVLIATGFDVGMIPPFTNAEEFWDKICQYIDSGKVRGGFETLIEEVNRQYPFKPLDPDLEPTKPSQSQGNKALSLIVSGWDDPLRLNNRIRDLANEMGMPPDSVQLGFANQEGILVHLIDWTPEQALQLGKLIDAEGRKAGHSSQSGVETNPFRDYLLWQLFVEGPDQARFELNNLRASTILRDIAQGVLATQYDQSAMGIGPGGRGRRTTIDRVKSDGSTERCDPDKTLHESNIRDGDTLHVAPESTAGSINPMIREEALARVRSQIVAFAQSHSGFHVEANARHTPTEYIIRFRAPSFAPPAALNSPPLEIDSHEVFLVLPPDFPMKAPMVFWQTPIFHPNVSPKNGEVCLGDLGEHYRPGLDFGELCQMLIDIAAFRNYAVSEGYNMDAQEWAMSEDGQEAIENRGGKSVTHKIIDELTAPRPLQIKRIKR
jgi:hypothetical protein